MSSVESPGVAFGQAHKPRIVAGLRQNQRTRGLGSLFGRGLASNMKQSPNKGDVGRVVGRVLARIPRPPFDGAQCNGRFSVVNPGSVRLHFRHHRRNLSRQPLGRERSRSVLVEDPSARSLQSRRDRRRGLRNVLVEETTQGLRLVSRNNRVDQEEELVLPLSQVADRWEQHSDISLLLLLHDGRGVLSGRRQMNTRFRALNLDQALGTAADCADARP